MLPGAPCGRALSAEQAYVKARSQITWSLLDLISLSAVPAPKELGIYCLAVWKDLKTSLQLSSPDSFEALGNLSSLPLGQALGPAPPWLSSGGMHDARMPFTTAYICLQQRKLRMQKSTSCCH